MNSIYETYRNNINSYTARVFRSTQELDQHNKKEEPKKVKVDVQIVKEEVIVPEAKEEIIAPIVEEEVKTTTKKKTTRKKNTETVK